VIDNKNNKTMRQILHNQIKKWPMQVTVLAMTFIMMTFGFLIQYAPSIYNYHYYSVSGLSFSENTKRIDLIQQSIQKPNFLSGLTSDDVELILRKPSLVRVENNVQAWHDHGDSCAIDIYFKDGAKQPDYIEFRALTLNENVSKQFADTDDTYRNQYCIKAVLAAQGVETPNDYVLRPTPTFDSPYSS
jgi:hypothetical protein